MRSAGGGITLAAAGAIVMLWNAPVADADPLTGRTYAEAAAKIAKWNSQAEIVSRVGNRVPTDQCIVTSWVKSTRIVTGQHIPHGNRRNGWPNQQYRHTVHLLHLDCNETLARPGSPGGSRATERGQDEAFLQQRDEYFRAHPDRVDQLQAYCSRHPERSVCADG